MSELDARAHASIRTALGVATLSDLAAKDVDAVVGYWHSSGDEHLQRMVIDRKLLGTANDTRKRMERAIRNSNPDQQSMAFAIQLDGTLIGYTLLNRYTAEVNHSHWHIFRSELRAMGISTALYPCRMKMYFELAAMRRVIHQTRTTNLGVNRMLDKFVPVAETCYIERPDGVASPGEFHLRYVSARDIPTFFEKAAARKPR